jgi:hypothetical protein
MGTAFSSAMKGRAAYLVVLLMLGGCLSRGLPRPKSRRYYQAAHGPAAEGLPGNVHSEAFCNLLHYCTAEKDGSALDVRASRGVTNSLQHVNRSSCCSWHCINRSIIPYAPSIWYRNSAGLLKVIDINALMSCAAWLYPYM